MRLTRWSCLIALLAFVIPVFGTGPKAYAQSKPVGKITLGWVKSTANLMAFISPELGKKHGLEIDSVNFNNAVDIMTAMINGQVDVGLLTPIHLIRAVDTKVDLVQISGNTRGNTGIVIAKKHGVGENDWEGFKKVMQQKKLRVASSRGSINELLALAEFARQGIDANRDLELVNIANFGQHAQALRSGEFDVIVTLEPLAALVITDGTGVLLSRPYNTPAGDLNTNYVVSRAWLAKNEQLAQAFVATLADASRRLSDKTFELEAARKLTGMSPEVLTKALSNSRYEMQNGLEQMKQLARLAWERKYVSRDVSSDLPNAVDGRFLRAAGVSE